ncbi:scavenger receptor cysteine-rich type 1 protein M130 isoform X2 [Clarias gariepinus]|uniref:scavenger receptor cysteine-rich type 1 protein M130 isoform X2 n=1 Tax=Clarias gariepinus TaxID=13013 RepID=UPI00234CB1B7|nr:scavenger receptor cysteine-rich type 1 protein M130 isoform X2 [Clarias gariepinus]
MDINSKRNDASKITMLRVIFNLILEGETIQLAGSNHFCTGRVEVYYNNQWGGVCDNGWNMTAAQVVCRQLGCGKAINIPQSASFGQRSGPIWMNNVRCSGSESNITQCSHNGFKNHSCVNGNDAGVICLASLAPYIAIAVTSVVLFISVLVIICIVKIKKKRKFHVANKTEAKFTKNTYENPQCETNEEEIDDEADYENAEMTFQQKEDSETSDNDYVNVGDDEQRRDVDNDCNDGDIYANCEA